MKEDQVEFINESGLEFVDISSEAERTYNFPNDSILTLKDPLWLSVSRNGRHRVFLADGTSWYIKPAESWAISWKAKEGYPNFARY